MGEGKVSNKKMTMCDIQEKCKPTIDDSLLNKIISLKSNSNSLISRNSTLLLTFHLVVLLQDTFCAEIMQISATMGPKIRIKSRLSSLVLFEV